MQEVIAALVAFFLVEPMQGYIAEWYVANGMAQEQAREVASCFTDQSPTILAQAGNDPVQALTHVVNYWIGLSSVDTLVTEMAPECVQHTQVV